MNQLPREVYRTVSIDPVLQRKVAVQAAIEGRSIKELTEEALEKYLETHRSEAAALQIAVPA